GREHRYLTGCGRSGRPGLAAGEYDRLVRYDMATGESVRYDTGAAIGEAVFVPRAGATGELDGYYLCFGRSLADDTSWLYVWDAADFPGPPRARAAIPAPVPNGMHANWFAA
ncbi:MAG: carotenoid oxygenase family protein, partial [Actinobacteria bacterium]|nr:carotenoid oxygenase family protein [Actinomycetota bacterium]